MRTEANCQQTPPWISGDSAWGRVTVVHLFEKRQLFTAGLTPEEKKRQKIEVVGNLVAMNSYCLLSFLVEDKEGVSPDSEKLGKEDGGWA